MGYSEAHRAILFEPFAFEEGCFLNSKLPRLSFNGLIIPIQVNGYLHCLDVGELSLQIPDLFGGPSPFSGMWVLDLLDHLHLHPVINALYHGIALRAFP